MKRLTDMNLKDLIVFENDAILIADKPSTCPVQPDQSGNQSMLSILEQSKKSTLHLVTRIDRPVSGLVLVAKSGTAQHKYAQLHIEKRYIALVHNSDSIIVGDYNHYHYRNGQMKKAMINSEAIKGYKPVSLSIEKIAKLDNYTAANIKILSGRFHQIRAQLAHLGAPIKGDVKYGARRGNKDRSIMLHAYGIKIPSLDIDITSLPCQENTLWNMATSHLL